MRILLLFCVVFFISCTKKDPSDPEFVVAKVNGTKILRQELNESLEIFLKSQGGTRDQLPEGIVGQLERQILNQLIESHLAVERVRKENPEEFTQAVESEHQEFIERIGSEEKYNEMLEKLGTSEEMLLHQIRNNVAYQFLLEDIQGQAEEISDESAEQFYADNPQYFERPETIEARHVLVAVDQDATAAERAEKKKEIDAARKRIVAGEKFGTVAGEVSDDPGSGQRGGMLPPFSKGRMVPEFEKMAFSSKTGEISPVFSTDFGFHFLEVLKKNEAMTLEYDQVSSQIKQNLKNNQSNTAVQEQIAQLREEIEIFLPESEIPARSDSLPGAPAATPEPETGADVTAPPVPAPEP